MKLISKIMVLVSVAMFAWLARSEENKEKLRQAVQGIQEKKLCGEYITSKTDALFEKLIFTGTNKVTVDSGLTAKCSYYILGEMLYIRVDKAFPLFKIKDRKTLIGQAAKRKSPKPLIDQDVWTKGKKYYLQKESKEQCSFEIKEADQKSIQNDLCYYDATQFVLAPN